ncbi:MAG: carboxypeptidase regulatory-like domain-containing protein [Acidobacteria bacterium]|nr:carboxypeptidase regulatory-like domain-containing protein [Acidobacteriota bacterium]
MALCVLCCAAAFSIATAQESRGTILGRVNDSSEAVVAGAKVEARHLETNTTVSSTTNSGGNYEIPYLLSGRYRVGVELAGFKKVVQDNIELRVNDRLMLNFTLEVGEVTQSVTVTAETPLLEAATASTGIVVDSRRVSELPIAGGSPFNLTRLAVGVANSSGHAPGNPTQDLASGAVAVNGTRPGSSEVTMDGAPNMYQRSSTYGAPPQDLVQEFKVQTTTYDATLGHASGAVVNVSTKSGTNVLHGSSYYFDSRIRSVPWFSNRWLYDTSTGPVTPAKREQAEPKWLFQRWGDTFSGPVVLPKLYNGRNRTFWSFGYEGLYARPQQQTFTGTVPAPEQARGDFSALLKLGSQYQIYDPATIAPAAAGRFSRQPLPGNVIPASRLDPIARKMVTYWPEPNAAGTADGRQNYFQKSDQNWDYRSMLGRLDQNFSEKHRLFFRLSNSQFDQRTQNMPSIAYGTINDQTGYRLALDDVFVFRPDLLLNLRYGLVYQNPRNYPVSLGFDLLSLGFPQSLLTEINSKLNPAGIAFPQLAVDGLTTLSGGGGSSTRIYYHTFGGTLSKLSGNHSFRAGGEFRLMRENGYSFGNVAPYLNFTSAWTRGPMDNSPAAPIGQGLASMLLGIPGGGSISYNASRAEQSTFSALFLHNDWKATRRLTLNLGLRYEYEGAATERFNRSVRGFDFQTPNPIEAQARANYARAPIPEMSVSAFRTTGGLLFAGAGGQPRGLWKPDRNNLSPRFGFAFQAGPKTVVRGGYGIFFDTLGIDRQHTNQGGFNQATSLIPSADNGLTFRATLANPFPDGIQIPPGASGGLLTFLGRGVTFFNEGMLNPYVQRWSLSVQRELPGRIVVETGYVGNRGTKFSVAREWNPIPAGYLSTSPQRDQTAIDFLSAQVRSPFSGLPEFAGTALASSQVNRSQLLRPLPHFAGVSGSQTVGYSYYHSLQVQAEKRFSKGVTFQAAWTYSKFMQATDFLNDTDALPEKVVSDLDYPHRIIVNAVYELPFGKGKPLLGGARGVWNHLAGGWQAQGIYEGQSGAPLGFGNAIFNGNLHDIPLPVSSRMAERWFNTGAGFERDARRQLGSNIRRFSTRFAGVRADGINAWDLSLFKNFRLTERWKAQFRVETNNALNHVMFAAPNTAPSSSAFGTITAETGHGPRRVDFGIKLIF